MSTLVCFALKEEAAPFRKLAYPRREPDFAIRIVGIGQGNARKAVRSFLDSGVMSPKLVLTCGFAGGLHPDLKLGDVVFQIGDQPLEIESQLLAAGAKPVKFFCADRIATTVSEKKAFRDQTGAAAVEMESGAIHAVCAERGIPCVTIRVISDTANEDLPLDFNALSKPDKSLDFSKLAWAIAKSPGKIGALMELQRKTSFAASQLAKVLAKVTLE